MRDLSGASADLRAHACHVEPAWFFEKASSATAR